MRFWRPQSWYFSVATAILSDEAQSEQLIPADIGRLVGDVRTRLQAAITLFRERYEGERERITETASPLGLMYRKSFRA